MTPDLSIIIVNFNTRDYLAGCLEAIRSSRLKNAPEVFVVDNASSDGSAGLVRERYPEVRLIENTVNRGYAHANNLALRQTRGRYRLLLNADTVVPRDGLQQMLDFMDAHPRVGCAGPKLVRASGELDWACRRSFPTPQRSFYKLFGLSKVFPRSRTFGAYNMTYLSPDLETEVDSVVGAFMLVRAEAMEQAGLMDEDFFLYGEDLDWAYRIKQAGWVNYYNPRVEVVHYKRASTRQVRARAQFEFYRAMYLFYRKHFRQSTPLWLHGLVLTGLGLRWGLALLQVRLARLQPVARAGSA